MGEHVSDIARLSDGELRERSSACQAFAAAHHTRPAYAASFAALLDRLAL